MTAAFLAILAGLTPAGLSAQAALETPYGTPLAVSDTDDSFVQVPLTGVFPSGIRIGATTYTDVYVGTNGYVTFDQGSSGYSPLGITGWSAGPIVAGQYDDLDPSKGGTIYHVQDDPAGYVAITWEAVAPFSTPTGDGGGTNTFQIVFYRTGRGATDFDLAIRYATLDWARSGNIGSWPTAGWSAGDGNTYDELDHSGLSSFRQILGESNVGSPGVYLWQVTGGIVESPPTVNATAAASGIGATTATTGGTVSSDGGYAVTERGVAYATTSSPTRGDGFVADGVGGTGSFEVSLSGLASGTTYYLRAYATNALGTSYGPQQTFTTLSIVPPTVTTAAASDLVWDGATGGGEVTSDGGATVTARGLAFGTSPAPTTADAVVAAGAGVGAFTGDLVGLDPNTTYHVRAWATNSVGTAYGNEVTFTTPKRPQTITFPAPADRTYGDDPFALGATAASGLAVQYSTDDPSVATVAGDVVTITGAGSVTLTASQPGDDAWASAPDVQRSLTVAPRPVRASFEVPAGKVYDGDVEIAMTGWTIDGLLEADEGAVSLTGQPVFLDPAVGENKPVWLPSAALSGARAGHYELDYVAETRADILPGAPHHLALDGAAQATAGEPVAGLTVTLQDEFGNPTPATSPLGLRVAGDTGPEVSVVMAVGADRVPVELTLGEPGLHSLRVIQTSGPDLPGQAPPPHEVVVTAGGVQSFLVESADGGEIGAQTRGVPFPIRVVALDAAGNVASDFTGPVVIESDGLLGEGGGSTAPFTAGVLEGHRIEVAETGAFVLTASTPGGGATGSSAAFEVAEPRPDIRVSIVADDETPAPGSTVTIDVIVSNDGTLAAEEVTIENPVTAEVRLETMSAEPERGILDAAQGLWRVGRLEPGESVTLRIVARVLDR